MSIFKTWIGKNVFVQLKSGRIYNGVITVVEPLEANPDIFLVSMEDIFGKEVMFYSIEMDVIETKNGNNEKVIVKEGVKLDG